MEIKSMENKQLHDLRVRIILKKKYALCLQKRLILIREGYTNKSEFEKNEVDISVHNTNELILRTNGQINELEELFELELKDFVSDIEEIDANYKQTLELAKEKQKDITKLKHLLYYVNWKYIDENIEEKIKLYKNIKEILWESEPKPTESLKEGITVTLTDKKQVK